MKKNESGFTMVELMITLSIAAILLGVAVPSFMDSIRKNRLITQTNDIVGTLSLARMEAIKRGRLVYVCAKSDDSTCSGSTNWANGWLMFLDNTSDATITTASASADCSDSTKDCVLRVWQAVNSDVSLNAAANSSIAFGSQGMTNLLSTLSLDLTAAGCGSNEKRTISVSVAGRVNTLKSDCP